MNILIVGNGFDLSHYLPTKYDHFMVAMTAIENWDEQNGEMSFDDLFGSLYEKENYFFKYTKAMYQTDEIKISKDQIKDLKQKLKENVWYQYFSDHVREVKTWIDFEQKIEEALNYTTDFIYKINDVYTKENTLELEVRTTGYKKSDYDNKFLYLSEKSCNALFNIGLLDKKFYEVVYDSGEVVVKYVESNSDKYKYFINPKNIKKFQNYDIYNNKDCVDYLNYKLDEFICIFNFYLKLVDLINPINNFVFLPFDIDRVYSFNYTNTFRRFYSNEKKVNFLHGVSGNQQNIVLGISDLKDESLKKIKAYGFTKYHQKLLKNTDYLFLTDIKEKVEKLIKSLEFNEEHLLDSFKNETQKASDEKFLAYLRGELEKTNGNIYIWGHSLDISDDNYIKEIFSFNDSPKHNFNIVIFHYSNQAKFDLLTNLLHILGKEKVERWMKKGWLKFEPNPDIVEINNIQPVDLPKFEK
ncbi:AbiH family protein [Acinetobacter beijerinckii]|uniref:AbiH family protein n=1 Tax=Acinetobacter beijerinckii TaxID=262668 RepID=UPI0024058850|nr:AbiH family protein [Acinetobacter beijerinckii]